MSQWSSDILGMEGGRVNMDPRAARRSPAMPLGPLPQANAVYVRPAAELAGQRAALDAAAEDLRAAGRQPTTSAPMRQAFWARVLAAQKARGYER
ncbi:MAG: hypothetical protein ACRD1C_03740 [Terriglobales bacterium]